MQFQTIALTAVLATAIALPLPDLMGHFSFKRQVVPADITGAAAGASSGLLGPVGGLIGAATGVVGSVGGLNAVGGLTSIGGLNSI